MNIFGIQLYFIPPELVGYTHGTWKWPPGKNDSYWKPLVLGGYIFFVQKNPTIGGVKRIPSTTKWITIKIKQM